MTSGFKKHTIADTPLVGGKISGTGKVFDAIVGVRSAATETERPRKPARVWRTAEANGVPRSGLRCTQVCHFNPRRLTTCGPA